MPEAVFQRALLAARIYWKTDIPTLQVVWGLPPGHPSYTPSAAELGGNRIWLNPDAWAKKTPRGQCETFVHEYGHLLGHPHTKDGSIMDQLRSDGIVRACRLAKKGISFRPQHVPRLREDLDYAQRRVHVARVAARDASEQGHLELAEQHERTAAALERRLMQMFR